MSDERKALLAVRNWLDVQFNEPFKNDELARYIGIINDALNSIAATPTSPDDDWEERGAAEELRQFTIKQCTQETAGLIRKGQAFVDQVSVVLDRLGHGQAYSSTLSAMNDFKAALAAAPQAQEGGDDLDPVRMTLRTIAADLRACVKALGEDDDLGAVLTGYADAADAVLKRTSDTRPLRGGE